MSDTTLISGVLLDSVKNEPLPYATVSVLDTNGIAKKSVITDEKGVFTFKVPTNKMVSLSFAHVNYRMQKKSVNPVEATVKLGNIKLSPENAALQTVVVTAVRPLIKQEVDKIVFDVTADPENKSVTVLDMLRKVPLVSVDGNDNIKLKGNNNYKIFINGKPSALMANNPADVLRAMPATNIINIEVITTPPAKYDAEGLAGIINIITKKNADEGYNGSVNVRHNTVHGSGANLNLMVKQRRFGINGYIGHNRSPWLTTENGNYLQAFAPVPYELEQTGETDRKRMNTFGNAEASLELDTLNLLTATIQFFNGSGNFTNSQLTTQYNSRGAVQQKFQLVNTGTQGFGGTDVALNYEKTFAKNKAQMLTTSYKYSRSFDRQVNINSIFQRVNYSLPDFRQNNNSGSYEHTGQVDYVHPHKKITIEAGAKAIWRENYSFFTSDDFSTTEQKYINDPRSTNDFTYRQDVYSVYNSLQAKMEKMVVKAGLRLEQTMVDGFFAAGSTTVHQRYANLIPSLSLQKSLKEKHNFTLGYSQRIQRPGIWQINPFVNRANPKFVRVGNPQIRPVVNRNIELNYTNFKKGSISAGLSYSFANNTVEEVNRIIDDSITIATFVNTGKNKRLGVNLNINYPFTPNLSVNINAQLLHVWLQGTFNNQFYENNGFQGYIFTYTTYKLKKGYRLGLNLGFDSRYVLLQGRDNYFAFTSLSATKSFLKEKATLSINANNPWSKFLRLNFYNSSSTFKQERYFDIYYRNFNISFNYKFGKLNGNIKKNRRNIQNDDVSGSGGRQ